MHRVTRDRPDLALSFSDALDILDTKLLRPARQEFVELRPGGPDNLDSSRSISRSTEGYFITGLSTPIVPVLKVYKHRRTVPPQPEEWGRTGQCSSGTVAPKFKRCRPRVGDVDDDEVRQVTEQPRRLGKVLGVGLVEIDGYRLWERNQASGTSEIVPPEHPSRKRDTRAGWVAAGTSAPLSKLVSRLSSQTTHVLVFNRSDSLRAPALAENHMDTWGPAGSARPA